MKHNPLSYEHFMNGNPEFAKVDYQKIHRAIEFYERIGYKYIEVPWIVPKKINAVTLPEGKSGTKTSGPKGELVGSGEQSFIQMMEDEILEPGMYQCVTPCFRDEDVDTWHAKYFLKVELIIYKPEGIPSYDLTADSPNHPVRQVCSHAKRFFETYTKKLSVGKTAEGIDIFFNNESINKSYKFENGLEIGSYGLRKWKDHWWAYGTGLAEPRFSKALSWEGKGYHDDDIQKVDNFSLEKIREELDEAIDARKSENTIMELVELSDMYGALSLYLRNAHPTITMEDLKKMSDATQRSFQNGRR